MTKITSFEIRGLAGRRRAVRHRLNGDVNVFWGANGSGKTSLLKILHSALSNEATSLLRVPFTSATVEIKTGEDDGPTYIRHIEKAKILDPRFGQLTFTGDDPDEEIARLRYLRATRPDVDSPGWTTEPEPITSGTKTGYLSHGYLPISRVSEARLRRGRTQPTTELIDEASFDRLFAIQIRDLWSDYNNRALLQIRVAQDRGLAGIVGSVLGAKGRSKVSRRIEDPEEAWNIIQTFFSSQRLGAMLRLNHDAFVLNFRDTKLVQEVVAEVADVQRGIDEAQEPQHRIEELLGRLYGGRKKVELRGRQVVVHVGDEEIPLELLSSGEKQLLQLLLECLIAGSNPVLIDEPELSLHVDWQNELVSCMRTVNESAQLIMATHSPEVMANLSDDVIFEL